MENVLIAYVSFLFWPSVVVNLFINKSGIIEMSFELLVIAPSEKHSFIYFGNKNKLVWVNGPYLAIVLQAEWRDNNGMNASKNSLDDNNR